MCLKSALYLKHKDGFYVRFKPSNLDSPALLTAYITRYIDRPPLAQVRISNYDSHTISFWFQPHEDGKRVDVHLPTAQFLGLLLTHIPEKSFQMLLRRLHGKPRQVSPRRCCLCSSLAGILASGGASHFLFYA